MHLAEVVGDFMKTFLEAVSVYFFTVVVITIYLHVNMLLCTPPCAEFPIIACSILPLFLFFLLRLKLYKNFLLLSYIILFFSFLTNGYIFKTGGIEVIRIFLFSCFGVSAIFIAISFMAAFILIPSIFLFLQFVKLLNWIIGFGEKGKMFITKIEYLFERKTIINDDKKLKFLKEIMEKCFYNINMFCGFARYTGCGGRSGGSGSGR